VAGSDEEKKDKKEKKKKSKHSEEASGDSPVHKKSKSSA